MDSITSRVDADGIAEIVLDRPPVNALPVAGWFDLARVLHELGEDPAVRVVVLRAEGRGFNAGVDIKEMRDDPGFGALVGANHGCFAAFAAVYECPVPVVAAVHGFCLGGGIGLAGNADVIVAADDATFALPEVDRGALGAATHLSRLVPQHKMRAMAYTATHATAHELHAWGSVWSVVPPVRLREEAYDVARVIATKDPRVIRAAKQSLNGIDPQDVHRSYRYEQGFTYELNLAGAGPEARATFGDRTGEGKAVPGRAVPGGAGTDGTAAGAERNAAADAEPGGAGAAFGDRTGEGEAVPGGAGTDGAGTDGAGTDGAGAAGWEGV